MAAGEVTIDGEGERGMCSHDSGGPLLVVDGAATVRVAGVLSFGDDACLDHDTFARVDEQAAWISLFAGPAVAGGTGGYWCL